MLPDAYLANALRIYNASNGQVDECAARSIIHAAYYAVYHLCANTLKLNPSTKGQAQHALVAGKVNADRSGSAILMAAKSEYNSLLVARIDADYRLSQSLTSYHALIAIRRALRIFRAAGIIPVPT